MTEKNWHISKVALIFWFIGLAILLGTSTVEAADKKQEWIDKRKEQMRKAGAEWSRMQEVEVEKGWTGAAPLERKRDMPGYKCVDNKKELARLWKLCRKEEPVPEVDFKRNIVLVTNSGDCNNIPYGARVDERGYLIWRIFPSTRLGCPRSGEHARFNYAFKLVKRNGMKCPGKKLFPFL